MAVTMQDGDELTDACDAQGRAAVHTHGAEPFVAASRRVLRRELERELPRHHRRDLAIVPDAREGEQPCNIDGPVEHVPDATWLTAERHRSRQ